jgi:hypothetical protein
MKIFIKSFSLAVAFALVSVSAFAVPTLTISDGVNGPVVITDNLGGDLSGIDGNILWTGTIGSWAVSVATGQTKPFIGSASEPILNINTTATRTGGSAGSLTIELWEDGFTSNQFQGLLTGSVSSINGSGTGQAEVELSGADYLSTAPVAYSSNSGLVPLNLAGNASFPVTPYSLLLRTVATINGNGTVNINAALASVPEPGFYGALALGLSGLFAMAARRRRASVKE